jgi:flavin reductase (DIM6/NTAB) family NADH-FMN oxidoreductase RutF
VPRQGFLDAMARLPAGVVVISARSGDEFRGLTASSLVSVSVDPPLVAVALEHTSATRAVVLETRAFNVSVLTRQQEFIADRFAGRAPALDLHWRTLPHRLGTNGIPLLDGCAAWLECLMLDTYPAGDHDICIAAVEAAELGAGDPLILWDRTFWTLR